MSLQFRSSFTLIELLIVIAILAVLAVAVVLVLNPAQLLAQGRDSTRLSDLSALNSALSLFQADQYTQSLGTPNTLYVSVPDTTSTCANLGLSSPPIGWAYHCVPSSSSTRVDGTGWIPVNLTLLSSGSPLSKLPIDPTNTTSSGLYYTYVSGGSYALSSALESQKYLVSTASQDQGYDPGRYEIGSDLSLIAKSEGLVGWWPLDGNANDMSGDSYNMTASGGSPTWLSGSNCKVGNCVFLASSTNQAEYVDNASKLSTGTGDFTYSAWVDPVRRSDNLGFTFFGNYQYPTQGNNIVVVNPDSSTLLEIAQVGLGLYCSTDYTSYFGSWHLISFIKQSNNLYIYVDSIQKKSCNGSAYNVQLGNGRWYIDGGNWRSTDLSVDDLRVYDKALSAAEIQAIYNAQK